MSNKRVTIDFPKFGGGTTHIFDYSSGKREALILLVYLLVSGLTLSIAFFLTYKNGLTLWRGIGIALMQIVIIVPAVWLGTRIANQSCISRYRSLLTIGWTNTGIDKLLPLVQNVPEKERPASLAQCINNALGFEVCIFMLHDQPSLLAVKDHDLQAILTAGKKLLQDQNTRYLFDQNWHPRGAVCLDQNIIDTKGWVVAVWKRHHDGFGFYAPSGEYTFGRVTDKGICYDQNNKKCGSVIGTTVRNEGGYLWGFITGPTNIDHCLLVAALMTVIKHKQR